MRLRAWIGIIFALALPLICLSLVLTLVSNQQSDRSLRRERPRSYHHQPQPIVD
ncbi:MAG TPA: hypothetical protein V6D50_14700 [Chroococcales cyanobacterium]